MSLILGIETSCDETGIALVRNGREVLANEVASQIDVHAPFGGVVPEIASRLHTGCIVQLLEAARAKCPDPIDAVAATIGPGLKGSLLVGANFGKALAYAWGVPFVPVQHIEGHLFSGFLAESPPRYPFLALVVSGGHTCLIWCPEPHRYETLGTTRDDAVGESFDKVARLLGLPYPGGPSIQRAAEGGNPKAYAFPRAMRHAAHLDFSYSGLKTAVLYELREPRDHNVADLAASFQEAAVDILVHRTQQAVERTGATCLVVAGGVAANTLLRARLTAELPIQVCLPPFAYCLDNGAMIAAAAHSRLARGLVGDLATSANSRLSLQYD